MKKALEGFLGVFCLAAALAGCPSTCNEYVEPTKGAVVDCSKEFATKNAIKYIAPVNDCLTGDDYKGCLLGVGADIGMELVYCVVQRAGSEYWAMSQANPEDAVSAQAAENARRFLEEQDVSFAE